MVLFETGSRSFQGWNSIDLLLSWLASPQYWENQPFLQVGRDDVRRQLNLDEKRLLFSPRELIQNPALQQYADRIQNRPGMQVPAEEKPGAREQELKHVLDRIGTFRSIVSGDAWLVIPKTAPQPWASLAANDKEGESIRIHFVELVKAYQAGDQSLFERTSVLARAGVEGEIPSFSDGDRRVVAAESFYNRSRPFLFAWILYLIAAVAWISYLVQSGEFLRKTAKFTMTVGLVTHVTGIVLRCYIAGRPPVTNMYESINWVCLGIIVFSIVLSMVQKQAVTLAVGCALATFGLIAGDSAPAMMDPGIHPLVPVLRSNYWLTIHVLTITLSYAAFALTAGLGNVALFHFARGGSRSTAKTLNLNQLIYRAMQFGVVLVAAGTILGGVWADYSWGRFWGWDPKEVWALITLLAYVAILHGRYTGWVTQFGFTVWTVVSFMTVIMAWYGVNFVLGVGLHSYGFSTGGRGWVALFVGLQLLYVAITAAAYRIRTSRAEVPA